MTIFSKDSLETLRQRIDLVDVLSSHIDLKRSGAAYKGLCPFHDEKSPSFMIQKGDSHYHCFGCGAHGDAIQFLMTHLKMGFSDAVESLAQRFNVILERIDSQGEEKGPNKAALKEALDHASRFFHLLLLHTADGHEALQYLFRRGIDLDFIRRFRIGLSPRTPGVLRKTLHAKFVSDDTMAEAGLISPGKEGGWRDFFYDRITFPICDPTGSVIGFSARKFKEETFGGKYINTPETPLFKKSKVLFALHHSRKRIAKERKAIIVEGQIDALRLIASGLNNVVASQGTAFGEGHVRELLSLGVNQVFLAFDSDEAGRQAAYKVGDLFQKEGVDTRIVTMPVGEDPDSFLRENGPEAFIERIESGIDYLTFALQLFSQKLDIDSPAGKNEIVQVLVKQIRNWNHPLMVHESLRKLAHLARLPEEMIGVGQDYVPNLFVKKMASIGLETVDPDRVLETDFLRWLVLIGNTKPSFLEIAKNNIELHDLRVAGAKALYLAVLASVQDGKQGDMIDLALRLEDASGQDLIADVTRKKVNLDRSEEHFLESVQKILDRNWMGKCEAIKAKIQSAQCSDEEVLVLVKEFDALRRHPPKAKT